MKVSTFFFLLLLLYLHKGQNAALSTLAGENPGGETPREKSYLLAKTETKINILIRIIATPPQVGKNNPNSCKKDLLSGGYSPEQFVIVYYIIHFLY